MDTPKQRISWLECFPPDIWAYFAYNLTGEQIGRLMMTGATYLRRLLLCPKVVKSTKLCKNFVTCKSLPAFLNDLPSLEELSIHSITSKGATISGITVESVPSGVRKLVLTGDWSEPSTELFGASLHNTNNLPCLETLNFLALDIESSSWMIYAPQSLTDLRIPTWDGVVALPSSLIHFEVNSVHLSTNSFVSKLPPSLDSFVVNYGLTGLELIVPLLPHSLRKLSFENVNFSDQPMSQQNLLEHLPKSLTCLSCRVLKFQDCPELAAVLPSTLTELTIHAELPRSVWSLLPRNLTKLAFSVPTKDGEGKVLPFDHIPRSIKTLDVRGSPVNFLLWGPPGVPNQSYFPPQLTKLSMQDFRLTPEAAMILPASLTFLQIRYLCERTCKHLPAGIRTLISRQTIMSPELIKFLPTSLTFLNMTFPYPDDPWFNIDTGESLGHISRSPEYSLHKLCLSKSFDWKDSSPLPPNLTHLDLCTAGDIGNSFLIRQQLPYLLTLNMESASQFSDSCFPLSSPNLVILNLSASRRIGGCSFQSLPRCLTFLKLNWSQNILDAHIQYLPRTLKYAHLSRAIHLTEQCIQDLPPHLEFLNLLLNSHITSSCAPSFPASILSPRLRRSIRCEKWYLKWGIVHQTK